MMKKLLIIKIILLIPFVIIAHPLDNMGCKEDLWIKKIENQRIKIISSSILKPGKKYNYNPKNLLDKNKNTCWCPKNIKGKNGIDEFIIMKIPYGIKGIKITNGFAKNRSFFYKNNRVKKIYLGWINLKPEEDLCGKTKYTIMFQTIPRRFPVLKDTRIPQKIIFSKIKRFGWKDYIFKDKKNVYLIIGIVSIYKGSKYNDTCISEIEIIK